MKMLKHLDLCSGIGGCRRFFYGKVIRANAFYTQTSFVRKFLPKTFLIFQFMMM